MKLSITTIIFLPLVYLFLVALNFDQPSFYYEPIPYKFLGLYVLMFIGFFILLWTDLSKKKDKFYHWYRLAVIASTILVILGAGVWYQILSRHIKNDFALLHDGSQMTEVASDFLWQGKNPYAEYYGETPFGIHNSWELTGYGRENPANYHYVYLPFYLLTSAIFQKISLLTIGWFDLRFVFILALIFTLYLIYRLVPDREEKLLAILLFAFNPIYTFYFVTGYNDIFAYVFLTLSIYLLYKKKYSWSVFAMGLAVLSKQSIWLALPFYFFHLLWREKGELLTNILTVVKKLWPIYVVVLVIAIPFIIWSPSDFIADTITYASGGSEHIFPIYGSGISELLVSAGIVSSIWDYFPFWIIQLIVGLPLLIALILWQKKNNTISRMVVSYMVFLLVYWFLSRFFNPNYVAFISMLAILAWAVAKNDNYSTDDA